MRNRLLGLMGVILVVFGAANAATITYTYDDMGRLKVVDYGNGVVTTYDLDPAGNRNTLQTSDGTAPTVPTNLVVTPVSPTQANLSWTASTDNVGVTEYWIERCTGSGCSSFAQIQIVNAPTVTYSDTTLASYTVYRYQLRAKDGAGNLSGYTPAVSVTTLDGTPPSTPTGLGATAVSPTQINLSWTASTDNVGVTGYRVERCTGASCSDFAEIASPGTTSHSDTTAVNVTTYRYRVRATDAATNFSGYSSIVSATTPDGTPPSTPTGLGATAVSPTQINLSWTASTDNVAVTGYLVERCSGAGCGNFAQIATPSGTSHSDAPLSPATSYSYRVRARDAVPNYSGYSSTASATTPAGVPGPTTLPGGTLFKIQGQSYTITWTSVSGATYYELYQSVNGGASNLNYSGTALSKLFSNAVAGQYVYNAKACNTSGCSGLSNSRVVNVCPVGGCQ